MSRPRLHERVEAQRVQRAGQDRSRVRRTVTRRDGVRMEVDGHWLTGFCGNDYLGLAQQFAVVDALQASASRDGAGGIASHLVCGHHAAHDALERELADWLGAPRALLFGSGYLANLPAHPDSVPINRLVQVAGTPLAGTAELDPFEFVRTIAVARLLMPQSMVRLSAGRETMSDEMQALCFAAGANSIFYGEKLLTTGNPDVERDQALFARLGLRPMAVVVEDGAPAADAGACSRTVHATIAGQAA